MSSASLGAAAGAFLLATAVTSAARAADTPVQVTAPDHATLHAALPSETEAAKLGGRAIVHCEVSAEGVASACRLIHEYPSAHGFGQALLSLIPRYRLKPATKDGGPVASEVTIEQDWYPQDARPDWIRKPTPSDLMAVFPRGALEQGRNGQATISCVVNVEGALSDCLVVSERPAGEHFGDAALALTPQFLLKPATLAGHPTPSVVNIPINFVAGAPARDPTGSVHSASAAMVWPEAPSYADVVAAYPARGRATKLGGRATLFCRFTREGRLNNCQVIAEEPRGDGFGRAAKALAEKFRAFTATSEGKGLGDVAVQVPFTFDPKMLDASEPVVGSPQWAALPGADDVKTAFAGIGKDVGESHVMLECKVQQGGTVSGCSVASETPAGHGVGQAALALAPKFRLNTWTIEGLPVVGGTIRIPLRYEPDKTPAAAKP